MHGIGRFAAEMRARLNGFTPISLRSRPSSPLDPLLLSQHLRSSKPGLFFSPGYNAPLGTPCPFIFTIHDLNHLFVRENSSALKRAYYSRIIRPAVHRARMVLTISEFSRRAICEWARADERSVINVGNGVSAAFMPQGAVFSAARPYFLHIGNHKPHKNFERLLRAFAASGLNGEFMFVTTCPLTRQLRETVRRLDLAHDVLAVEAARDEDLAALYRGARLLACVSLYEGFGLPIVEAMACGTPVLTSSVASMPEVAGDAAMTVDPYDTEAIAAGLQRLSSDLALRRSLSARGLERAKRYSWDATLAKVETVLAACA